MNIDHQDRPGAGSDALLEWRSGWRLVLSGIMGLMLSTLHIYTFGVMLGQLEAAFGWSRTMISSGPLIISFGSLLTMPLVGIAVDRFGARAIGLTGVVFLCGSFGLLSLMNGNPVWWFSVWTLLAIGSALISA